MCWLVEDATNLVETFRREDILTDHDDGRSTSKLFSQLFSRLITHIFQFYYSDRSLPILVCTGLVEGVMGDGFNCMTLYNSFYN